MKFKVEKKDFIIFILYSILLLYLCCVAVLNFASLSKDGSFYGLLPFKAFIPPYLPVTIILFLGGEILVFTSASSYIFSKDKKSSGVGVTFKTKESDGYAKWADKTEITKAKGIAKIDPKAQQLTAAGIPIINNGKEVYVDDGENHNLIIGSTGSGKTECFVKPMVKILSRNEESMIITDPKGEIYQECREMLKEKGYNVILLNFRDPEHGNCWNPLEMPYRYYHEGNKDKSIELLEDVSKNILKTPDSKADPFWEDSASDYFTGLALGLFEDAKSADEVNISSINYMSTVGEDRFGPKTYLYDYFLAKGEDSNAYICASNTITAPSETKGSILSTFRQKIRIFSSRESISEMLSRSDFDMKSIGREKTAVFLTIHDEKKTYHGLLTIFLKQCYETLIDVAQENGGKLNYRTNFILDEFANMPALKDVDAMVSAARSRRIRFTFIIQNFSQLSSVYTKEVGDTIKGNCGNLLYLISTEISALKEISELCGEVKGKDKDKSATRPLISVTDLQKMKLFDALINRQRGNPFKTHLTPDFEMNWGVTYPKANYPQRSKNEIKLFDIKTFVSDRKQKQMMEAMENGKDDMNHFNSPFGGFRPSPFSGPSPMGESPFGPLPNSANNPFVTTTKNPFGPMPNTSNSFNSNKNNTNNPFIDMNNVDIDAMMKDIDKKLKELEDEEKLEKEKLKSVSSENVNNDLANILEANLKSKPIVENIEDTNKVEEPKIIKDDLSKKAISNDNDLLFDDDEDYLDIPINIYDNKKGNNITNIVQLSKKTDTISDTNKTLKDDVKESAFIPTNNNSDEKKSLNDVEEVLDDIEQLDDSPKINVDIDSIIMDDSVITDDEFFDDFFSDD